MKTYWYLFLLVVCSACATSTNYEIEDQQYNCLKEKYQENKKGDLDELILAFENELIKKELLKDHSSASLHKCLQTIAEKDRAPLSMSSTMIRPLLVSQKYGSGCLKSIRDSSGLSKSRLIEIVKESQNVFTKIGQEEEVNPQSVSKALIKIYKQKDFDHPVYRLNAFVAVGYLAEYENQSRASTGALNKMVPAPISEQWMMKLFLNKHNKILIDDEAVSFDEFIEKVDQFFMRSRNESKQSKRIKDRGNYALGRAFISFGNEKGTDYDFYLKVYKELKNRYAKLLNKLAKEVFDQPFDQLNKDQQKSIKGLQPWMVSESEPLGD